MQEKQTQEGTQSKNMQHHQLCIALVGCDETTVKQINEKLGTDMLVPWALFTCEHLADLNQKAKEADVIVLTTKEGEEELARRVFGAVKGIKPTIPIICLTGESAEERTLAVRVMEMGAADIMIRGAFGRLADAIIYAIIRQKIVLNTKTSSDRKLGNLERGDKAHVKKMELTAVEEKDRVDQLLSMFMGGYIATK